MTDSFQAAYLLHSRPYKENQLLLDLLTEDNGKISAVTFSGQSLKSNKKSVLQPFSPLTIAVKGNGSLKKLTLVEAAGKSYLFQGRYLYSAFYLNEIIIRLFTDEFPCGALFSQYVESLQQLDKQENIELTLRQFEMVLLDELGLTIDFTDICGQYQHYYYIAQQGFVPAINKLSQPCYDKAHLLAIASQAQLSAEALYTYKLLMRQIITPLLGNKPLNSRKFFNQR